MTPSPQSWGGRFVMIPTAGNIDPSLRGALLRSNPGVALRIWIASRTHRDDGESTSSAVGIILRVGLFRKREPAP